ncbi:ATP phosphoribosyltransferase [uncultured Duncaniella sp.]|jgi:ATP phosphoribosyltransferase|uniref:ATP phosphoribosyltransferase n=1 Tax=uncultured Duncaniella sp. TaxID=2768039 RepID=UPI0026748718|nr:ATP phosphoribosyltransferase [uncultured Duncaniella sp.]MCI9171763.1 ATP phosphoribosyltransferase [Muribaculaceae bacterium]
MLKIAIQAKGRLNEQSMDLLADAGISASSGNRKLITKAKGFPMEILYLRDDDIPQAVAMGVADIGIVGMNEITEKGEKVEEILPLGFGACRISIAVPREVEYTGTEWLNGRRIATSYPNILRTFFAENGISAEIHEIAGSVEIAPAVGMSDAIFDIVSSGGTLIQNGLREVEQVFFSEAVLIATPDLPEEKRADLDKLKFRLNSILDSRGMKYVLMNLPRTAVDQAVKILPGMKSPTLLPLTDPEWCSLHVVIPESELWEKIEQLKEIGAEDILILNLENIIR